MLNKLKENLAQSQARTKKYADQGRLERHFNVGDIVYVKLQPFRQFGFH
jgi:ribosomal protein L21E